MGVIDYIGENFVHIDAGECEKKLRDANPRLLRSDERVVLAFKGRGGSGRDKHVLTTARVLIRDKKGEYDIIRPLSGRLPGPRTTLLGLDDRVVGMVSIICIHDRQLKNNE